MKNAMHLPSERIIRRRYATGASGQQQKKEETVSKDILDVDCGMGLIDGVMNES